MVDIYAPTATANDRVLVCKTESAVAAKNTNPDYRTHCCTADFRTQNMRHIHRMPSPPPPLHTLHRLSMVFMVFMVDDDDRGGGLRIRGAQLPTPLSCLLSYRHQLKWEREVREYPDVSKDVSVRMLFHLVPGEKSFEK